MVARFTCAFVCMLTCWVAAVPSTSAQESAAQVAARRTLIIDAEAARSRGDHEEALELAMRASEISMSPSLRLFIAQEQSATGMLVEAVANADICQREAASDETLRNRDVITATCRALVETLAPRLGRIHVLASDDIQQNAVLRVQGREVPRSLWSVPVVVTPGSVEVEAEAPGQAPFQTTVDVGEGRTETVTIVLESVPGSEGTGTSATGSNSGTDATTPVDQGEEPERSGAPLWPKILVGAGAASLVASGVLFALYRSERSDCPDELCPDQSTIDRVYAYAVATYITLGVGVAAVGIGLYAWLSHDDTPEPRTTAWVTAGRSGAVFQLQTSF